MRLLSLSVALVALLLPVSPLEAAGPANRVTILYDAFGQSDDMTKDWGFSALVEYGGKRILFDTGNNAEIFSHNVKAAGVDLARLDFVVISHRHLDHTAGLNYLLSVNPAVKIYAPKEAFGVFGSALPGKFYRRDESLPPEMRYYGGQPPDTITFGTPWIAARFEPVDQSFEVAPGVHIIALVSETPGTKELRELSIAVQTPDGIAVISGCAHPGIDRIVREAAKIDPRVQIVMGGFHLPTSPDADIARIANALRDELKVHRLAPGHCTGEPAFAAFRIMWGDRYIYAGVGSVIALP
ncbi:MAG: MBL fold metallo-hydrolase [Burkholderiales bacterium]